MIEQVKVFLQSSHSVIFQSKSYGSTHGSDLYDVRGGEEVGVEVVQVLRAGLKDGDNVRLPLLPVHGVAVGLELGRLLGPSHSH